MYSKSRGTGTIVVLYILLFRPLYTKQEENSELYCGKHSPNLIRTSSSILILICCCRSTIFEHDNIFETLFSVFSKHPGDEALICD